MAIGFVTCRKCGKTFDYEKRDGVCPKCARYYSLTNYNEEEALLKNIMSPANEANCSYHGGHNVTSGHSGHDERLHSTDRRVAANRNKTTNSSAKVFWFIVIIVMIIRAILSQ